MKIKEIEKIKGINAVYLADENIEITKGYCSQDLFQIGIEKCIWITKSVEDSAYFTENIKAVLITNGSFISNDFIIEAKKKGLSVFSSGEKSYSVAGKLYHAGIT